MKLILCLIVVIVLEFFTILPLFNFGFFDFHDNTQVARVYEMGKVLSSGIFPVRWVPDLGYGYGYPIFNFYGPLAYYIGGGLNALGFDSLTSTKLMFGFGILLSGICMFFFSRKFFGNIGGIVSAVIYAYFPYHAINIYVRGAVGEFFAYAFLPLFFLGIFQLIDLKKINSKIFLPFLQIAIGIFLITTSHNLTIFMTIIVFTPIILSGILFSKSKKIFFLVVCFGLVFGLLLSSFYLLPALFEMKYTNVASQIGGGADFKDHFVCLGQYWNSAWGFGGSVPGCLDGISFKLGRLNILIAVISLAVTAFNLYKKKFGQQEKVATLGLVIFLISIFFTLSASEFVWKSIPFIGYIQYPWRFINFIGLAISFNAGYTSFFLIKNLGLKKSSTLVAVIIAISIFTNAKLFHPQILNSHREQVYEEELYINSIVSKISDEYMPPAFAKPTFNELPKRSVEFSGEDGTVSLLNEDTNSIKVKYVFQKNGTIHINRAYFPSWKAYINGISTPLIQVSNGMDIRINRGSGTIKVSFENTAIQLLGNIITIISFLTLITVIIILSRIKK